MSAIKAAQLIYGTVEAQSSPGGRGGHQILMRTRRAIGEEEALEIEARLFYPSRSAPAEKYLFFPLAAGRHVLARVTPLEGKDTFGRGGAFFAHALVLDADALYAAENDPFRVFRSFAFCSTPLEAMAKWGGAAGGGAAGDGAPVDIAPAEIELQQPPPTQTTGTKEEWWPLTLTALRASPRIGRHEGLGLAGPPEGVLALLEALFPLIPVRARAFCSFDTYFSGGNLVRTPYWAAGGLADDFRSPEWTLYDLEEKRFLYPIETTPSNAFEQWLHTEWDSGKPLPEIARHAAGQFAIAMWLDGAAAQAITGSDEDIRQFVAAHRAALERRLAASLSPRLGAALADRLSACAARWLLSSEGLEARLKDDLRDAPVEQWLLEFASGPEPPAAGEIEALRTWTRANPQTSPALEMRVLRWAGAWAELSQAAASVDDRQYAEFAAWALGTVRVQFRPALYADRQTAALGLRAEVTEEDVGARGLLSALTGSVDAGRSSSTEAGVFDRLLRPRSRSQEDAGSWTPCRIPAERLSSLMHLIVDKESPRDR